MAKILSNESVPLAEEEASVSKRKMQTENVQVSTKVEENIEFAMANLAKETVEIKRVHVNREVDDLPELREEGDTLILPIVEEKLIIEKQLVLREEIHLVRHQGTTRHEEPITLRKMRAVVTPSDARASIQNRTDKKDP